VADNLVEANLTGHDSHGVGMLPAYTRSLLAGELKPNRHAEVLSDRGPMIVIDGGAGYGQVIGKEAMEIGIARAREEGVCVLSIRRSFHLCRIGAWGELCAAAGLVSMHHVNGVGHHGLVAPFRGSDARYTTNPYCCALPATARNPAVVADFATSVIALGKVRVAGNKGESLAEGILMDGDGRPTDDPGAMFREPRGALRPLGGEIAGHKGYCLALVNELLAGGLTGGGGCRPDNEHENFTILNNMLSVLIDPGGLIDCAAFGAEIDATLDHVRASPPESPDAPVQVPGDPERLTREARLAQGIPIDEESWREIVAAAESLGLPRRRVEDLAGGDSEMLDK
jgi:uncharacterized oxidoreductase